MKKYLIDSNVFFTDYKCLSKFGDNEVIIPITVIEELCKHKSDGGESGYNVRKSLKEIEGNEDITICFDYDDIDGLDMNINDNKIIAMAKKTDSILVSNDVDIRIKARKLLGLEAQEYKAVETISVGELRKGKHIIIDNDMLSEIYTTKGLKKLDYMYENDFVVFQDKKGEVLDVGKVKDSYIKPCTLFDSSFSGSTPRNLEQKMALTHLFNTDLELVTFSGAAGTSKSYLILGAALELIEKGKYNKIYIAKAPMSLDKSVSTGFKPGEFLSGKMALPLGSITSNLYNMKSKKSDNRVTGMNILEGYITFGKIEVLSLEDILGMSLAPNSILIVEEAQTLNLKMTKALYSRCGSDSVIFANADLLQQSGNNLLPEDSGFFKVINAFAGYNKSAHLTLEVVQRSNFVAELNNRLK